MVELNIRRIEPRFLKENQLLGLYFPGQGYVFFRVMGVETIVYQYSEVPGTIAANTQVDSTRLSISAYSIDNLLRVMDCSHIYQVFMGWKPGPVRQYLYYPYETARRNLDVKRIYTKSPFGFIDGFTSPYSCPSPMTEIFIPSDIDVGFSWYNPLNEQVTVEELIFIRRMETEVLRDPDLIEKILAGNQHCRLNTLGGVGDRFSYNIQSEFDIDPIKLGMSRAHIEAAVEEK